MSAEVHDDELHAFLDGHLPSRRCTAVLAYLGRHPHEIERRPLGGRARQQRFLCGRAGAQPFHRAVKSALSASCALATEDEPEGDQQKRRYR